MGLNMAATKAKGETVLWRRVTKQTIARFARGNISAQNERILLPDEQKEEHEQVREITKKWKARTKHGN